AVGSWRRIQVKRLRGQERQGGNGSVTAGEDFGGVRPSSGAAMMESEGDAMKSGASAYSVLAAPEDGRTPIASHPPSLTHYTRRPNRVDDACGYLPLCGQ